MKKCIGEITSLSDNIINELNTLYDYKIPKDQLISEELIEKLAYFTKTIKKEVAVCIDRKGYVLSIIVGEKSLVQIPNLWVKRNREGLSGIRCIHTHPNGNPMLSSPDLSTLVNLHLDSMVAIGIGNKLSCSIAFPIDKDNNNNIKYNQYENISIKKLLEIPFEDIVLQFDKNTRSKMKVIEKEEEKTLLVVIDWGKTKDQNLTEDIKEIENLAKTAGLIVSDTIVQKRDKPDPVYFIGKGKLQEISLLIQENQIDCVIFDNMLTPSQQSNLMNYLHIKVLDRTSLILDIFAQRAKTKEGKLQVKLAQLNYLLPRLVGKGTSLSRLGGGVGTRGPGETKLETDRRYIKRLIHNIELQLKEVKKQRQIHRTHRQQNDIPQVALVGYTNAGKSSLLNVLAEESVLAEDKLFATLDPVTRKIPLGNNKEVLLTDTVGFINNIPHQLVTAFRATLEEIKFADLLLHVVDITNDNYEIQIKTVNTVLKEIGVINTPMLFVFNKIDLLKGNMPPIDPSLKYCYISTETGAGIEELKEVVASNFYNEKQYSFLIPYDKGSLVDRLHKIGTVNHVEYKEEGTFVSILTTDEKIDKDLVIFQL